jgi:hypothetical protein
MILRHTPAYNQTLLSVRDSRTIAHIGLYVFGPQSWQTDSQRFSRLEERLRPITAPAEKLHHATEQLEKSNGTERWAAHPEGGSYAAGVVGLPSTGSGHATSTITAGIGNT